MTEKKEDPDIAAAEFYGKSEDEFLKDIAEIAKTDSRLETAFKNVRKRFLDRKMH